MTYSNRASMYHLRIDCDQIQNQIQKTTG